MTDEQEKALLVADDCVQSLTVGKSERAVLDGSITPEHIYGEIGDVISGQIPGRTNSEQITVFDSTGIVLQDLACCAKILHKAKSVMAGTLIYL